MAKVIPYDKFLEKRIEKSAKRILERMMKERQEGIRQRINDLLGKLNKEDK